MAGSPLLSTSTNEKDAFEAPSAGPKIACVQTKSPKPDADKQAFRKGNSAGCGRRQKP
jgi:hypothetical protein